MAGGWPNNLSGQTLALPHIMCVHLYSRPSALCHFCSLFCYFLCYSLPYFLNWFLQLSSAVPFIQRTLQSDVAAPWVDIRHCTKQKAELWVSVKQRRNQRTEHHTYQYVCRPPRPGSGSGSGSWKGVGFFLQNRCVPNDLGKLKPRQPAAAVWTLSWCVFCVFLALDTHCFDCRPAQIQQVNVCFRARSCGEDFPVK